MGEGARQAQLGWALQLFLPSFQLLGGRWRGKGREAGLLESFARLWPKEMANSRKSQPKHARVTFPRLLPKPPLGGWEVPAPEPFLSLFSSELKGRARGEGLAALLPGIWATRSRGVSSEWSAAWEEGWPCREQALYTDVCLVYSRTIKSKWPAKGQLCAVSTRVTLLVMNLDCCVAQLML